MRRTITKKELAEILDKHAKWRRGEDGGGRADLRDAYLARADLARADLRDADLTRADLRGAYLTGAYLTGAYLRDTYLTGADLRDADLRGAADLRDADLTRADLRDADLRDADLTGADLRGTCLDINLVVLQRRFCRECPPLDTGGRIVYRTAKSQYVGSTEYKPGHTYTAPHLSFDCVTACHPGIYAASLEWMLDNYPGNQLVICYVRDGDWIISAKGAIRCKKLRVLYHYQR